ncbi:hypothetical protein D9611_001825 [Ephemerocybe angulata]|uniref:Uncharacterized protein n=1 Tax=Ephemerocybe angulata TaxID=980116 RepID=A0A8H5FMT4_9AGAR|nr:hypothetical protein D9611_001825 [Tulosesus angulatus]
MALALGKASSHMASTQGQGAQEEIACKRYLAFLARARRDLAEVEEDGNPAIRVFPSEVSDGLRVCLVLTPYAGQWAGFRLHFLVDLPLKGSRTWPSASPIIHIDSGVRHPCYRGRVIDPSLYNYTFFGAGSERLNLKHDCSKTLLSLFTSLLHMFSLATTLGEYHTFEEPSTTTYLTEERIQRGMLPGTHMGGKLRLWLDCGPVKTKYQRQWDEQWRSDPKPDVVVSTYRPEANGSSIETVHKVKSIHPSPDRLHQFTRPTKLWLHTRDRISLTSCAFCAYGSPALPHVAPPSIPARAGTAVPITLLTPPATSKLWMLLDDNLVEIAEWLQTPSIRTFAAAYHRFDLIASQYHILQRRELLCSVLRTSYTEGVLGVRIFSGYQIRLGERWLSLAGFEVHDTDIDARYNDDGSWNQLSLHEWPTLFLPFALNPEHFKRVRGDILEHFEILKKASSAPYQRKCRFCSELHTFVCPRPEEPISPEASGLPLPLRYISSWMAIEIQEVAGLWIELLRAKDNFHVKHKTEEEVLAGTERMITRFCHLLHLALSLYRDDFAVTANIKAFVCEHVQPKQNGPKPTLNQYECLALLTILEIVDSGRASTSTPSSEGDPLSWFSINRPFLRNFFRNAAVDYLNRFPTLQVMEGGASDYRLVKTFEYMERELRRLMIFTRVHLGFVKTYRSNLSMLDESYGFVDSKLMLQLCKEIKIVMGVRTWPEFFRQVAYPRGEGMGKEVFSRLLRESVRDALMERPWQERKWEREERMYSRWRHV